jgi:hypothetical protein
MMLRMGVGDDTNTWHVNNNKSKYKKVLSLTQIHHQQSTQLNFSSISITYSQFEFQNSSLFLQSKIVREHLILYQLYLLNSPKLFNKFKMVNADTT